MEVTNEDIWTMLISTFRYSMGRSSYICGSCVELYKNYSHALSGEQKRQIIEEVEKELERAEARGSTLGMKQDHETWKSFVFEQLRAGNPK